MRNKNMPEKRLNNELKLKKKPKYSTIIDFCILNESNIS